MKTSNAHHAGTIPDVILDELAEAASQIRVEPHRFQSASVGCVMMSLDPTRDFSGRQVLQGSLQIDLRKIDLSQLSFRLLTKEGKTIGEGDVGQRGTFLIIFPDKLAIGPYRIEFFVDAYKDDASSLVNLATDFRLPNKFIGKMVPLTGKGATNEAVEVPITGEEVVIRLQTRRVVVRYLAENVPNGIMLIQLLKAEVPVGKICLVVMPLVRGSSPMYRTGWISIEELLPPETNLGGLKPCAISVTKTSLEKNAVNRQAIEALLENDLVKRDEELQERISELLDSGNT